MHEHTHHKFVFVHGKTNIDSFREKKLHTLHVCFHIKLAKSCQNIHMQIAYRIRSNLRQSQRKAFDNAATEKKKKKKKIKTIAF